MELILVLGCVALVVVVGRYAPVTGFVVMFLLYAWPYLFKALGVELSLMQGIAVAVGVIASIFLVSLALVVDLVRNEKGLYNPRKLD